MIIAFAMNHPGGGFGGEKAEAATRAATDRGRGAGNGVPGNGNGGPMNPRLQGRGNGNGNGNGVHGANGTPSNYQRVLQERSRVAAPSVVGV